VTDSQQPPEPRLIVQLPILMLGRLCLNTGLRMTYPFLPELARGVGTSLTAVSHLVALRAFTTFLGPFFGPLSERFGRRPIMSLAMLLFGLGGLVVFIWPSYWALGVTLSVMGLAKVIFDPAMQAYLGDTIPYQVRGKALAVTELGWAGSFLVGAPLVGVAIQRQGWPAPFFWLALSGLVMAVLLWRILPRTGGSGRPRVSLWAIFQLPGRRPVIWAAVVYVGLVMAANELILIVYGDWMESGFGLSLATLGLAAGVIGTAEIVGELFAGWSVDRFGKRPVIITTGLLNVAMYLIIPYTGYSLSAALASLFALFLFFEITVVGGIPLLTEIVPEARAVALSVTMAAGGLGRAAGAWLGPLIWQRAGLEGTGLAGAVCMLAAILILARWVREG
jgi:predicted MFS family arabinose efflux permease